jgi:hypothetical protein
MSSAAIIAPFQSTLHSENNDTKLIYVNTLSRTIYNTLYLSRKNTFSKRVSFIKDTRFEFCTVIHKHVLYTLL